jgi:peptidoglycan/LPS O-acetylase OafA/YrhL
MSEGRAQRLPGLDGLRGLAALLVAAYHAWVLGGFAVLDDGPGRALLGAGYSGVDVFFVLSGVVLMMPFAVTGQRGSLRVFVVRRVARLLPIYLLVMAVAAGFHRYLTHAPIALPPSPAGWRLLLEHVLFLQQFNPDLTTMGFGSDGVIWTLTIEACFYVVLPFVALYWVRRPLLALLTAGVLACCWQLVATHSGASLRDSVAMTRQLPAYAAHFGLGMTLSVVLVRTDLARLMRRKGARPVLLAGGVLGVAGYLGLEGTRGLTGLSGPYDNVIRSWLLLPAVAAVIVALATGGGRWLDSRPARALGDLSYGSYLMHLLPMRLLVTAFGVPADGSLASFFMLLATLPATYVVAALSYRFFEVPARRGITRRLSPRSRSGAVRGRLHDRGQQLPADGAGPGRVLPDPPSRGAVLGAGHRRRPHSEPEIAG